MFLKYYLSLTLLLMVYCNNLTIFLVSIKLPTTTDICNRQLPINRYIKKCILSDILYALWHCYLFNST